MDIVVILYRSTRLISVALENNSVLIHTFGLLLIVNILWYLITRLRLAGTLTVCQRAFMTLFVGTFRDIEGEKIRSNMTKDRGNFWLNFPRHFLGHRIFWQDFLTAIFRRKCSLTQFYHYIKSIPHCKGARLVSACLGLVLMYNKINVILLSTKCMYHKVKKRKSMFIH